MAGKVYVLDHDTYENMKITGTIESDSMYMVRETSSANPNMLSLYLGEARQADVCDITGMSVDFSDPENMYNIPSTYWVQNKILLCKDQSGDSYRGLVYDGTKFLELGSAPLVPDEITILTDANNVISGVGANVSGKQFTIDGSTITASDGAEIFNYIPDAQTNNIATGASSHVEGIGNVERGENNHIEGKNNSITGIANKQIHISGESNTLSSNGGVDSTISGYGNTVSSSYLFSSNISGYYNTVTSNVSMNTTHVFAYYTQIGNSNSSQNNQVSQSLICGSQNQIATDSSTNNSSYISYSLISGFNNYVNGGVQGSFISGYGNKTNGQLDYSLVIGYDNYIYVKRYGGNFTTSLIGGTDNRLGTSSGTQASLEASIVYGRENTIDDGVGLEAAFVLGYYNNLHAGYGVDGSIITGGYNDITSGAFSLFSGYHNTVTNSRASIVSGDWNTIGTMMDCIVTGSYNNITGGYQGIVVGNYLEHDNIYNTALFGRYNYKSSASTLLCIGNGTGSSSSTRKNALLLDSNGNMVVAGNVQSSTGATLSTVRNTLTAINANNASYTFATLPTNGSETVLSDTYTVEKITITDIANMPKADADNYLSGDSSTTQVRTSDYTAVLIFKKSSNLTDISTALTNFSVNDNTKIYLLNPDLDITDYTIIHIMLSYDGFNMTAIAAGYEEVAPT